eukprot:1157281-Pelagomonas_calceolata.AAC.3
MDAWLQETFKYKNLRDGIASGVDTKEKESGEISKKGSSRAMTKVLQRKRSSTRAMTKGKHKSGPPSMHAAQRGKGDQGLLAKPHPTSAIQSVSRSEAQEVFAVCAFGGVYIWRSCPSGAPASNTTNNFSSGNGVRTLMEMEMHTVGWHQC